MIKLLLKLRVRVILTSNAITNSLEEVKGGNKVSQHPILEVPPLNGVLLATHALEDYQRGRATLQKEKG